MALLVTNNGKVVLNGKKVVVASSSKLDSTFLPLNIAESNSASLGDSETNSIECAKNNSNR